MLCEYCHSMPATEECRVLLAQDAEHPTLYERTPTLWLCAHCRWLFIGGYPCACAECEAKRPVVCLRNYWLLFPEQQASLRGSGR
jgi:hypothetical protein